MAKKRSRTILTVLAVLVVAGGMVWAFRPQPVLVDIGVVSRGDLVVTIDEEGRTKVHDAYIVSTPVAGQVMRVRVDPGDAVTEGETIVARMLPTNPSVLDVRTREQARAAVTAAEAALRVAQADLNSAMADAELADADLERARGLQARTDISQAAMDRAERSARAADATVDRAEAAISMRLAELANAQAQLISFDDQGLGAAIAEATDNAIPLYAPASGRVLQVIQQNATTLPAGAPIMEIGDVDDDLEVVVELLSTDAVQVTPGDRVVIDKWGGGTPLDGSVARIDPLGFTKFSALGVEEQRVNAIVDFADPAQYSGRLGHGFRVEVRIVVEERDGVIKVPASALFRSAGAGDWSVFVVEDGRAEQRTVTLGIGNGVETEIRDGLSEDDRIVLYPSAGLSSGMKVAQRQAG